MIQAFDRVGFSRLLRERAKALGLSFAEIAAVVDVPETLVGVWALAEASPASYHLVPLAEALQVSPAVLRAFVRSRPIPARRTALAELLHVARVEKGLTPLVLAQQAGVDEGTVHQWETGSRQPGTYNLALLHRILGFDTTRALEAVLNPLTGEHP